MSHTLGEIFTHAQLLGFKTATAGPGADPDSVLVDHHVRSKPSPISQRPALLQAAAETTARVHPGIRVHLTLSGCSAVTYAPMEVKIGLKRLRLTCPRWEKYSLSPPPFRSGRTCKTSPLAEPRPE